MRCVRKIKNRGMRRQLCTPAEVEEALDRLYNHPYVVRAADWPGGLSVLDEPGLYSWRVDRKGAEQLAKGAGFTVRRGLIYLGQAGATQWPSGRVPKTTLKTRLHFHLRGPFKNSTLRRALSAVLIERLVLTAAGPMKLDRASEDRLSEWIRSHLSLAVYVYQERDTLKDLESRVVASLDPPLNIKEMPASPNRAKLSRLRKAIVTWPPASSN